MAIDGLLARKLNQRSALGAYLDPIADKLLLSSSFIILAFKHKLAWWLTIIVSESRRSDSHGRRGDLAYFRLSPVSAQRLRQTHHRIADTAGVHGGFGRGLSTSRFAPVNRFLIYAVTVLTVFSAFHYSFTTSRRLAHPKHQSRFRPPSFLARQAAREVSVR